MAETSGSAPTAGGALAVATREPEKGVSRPADDDSPAALHALIQALRATDGEGCNPVRVRLVEVLARRATQHHGPVAATLTRRAVQIARDTLAEIARTRSACAELADSLEQRHPALAATIAGLLARADLRGLERLERTAQKRALASSLPELSRRLTRCIDTEDRAESAATPLATLLLQQELALLATSGHGPAPPASGADGSATPAGTRNELRASRSLRALRARRHEDELLQQLVTSVPADAGPLNPQLLVIRCLAAMGDISPVYFKRLACYIDTLLTLDQFDGGARSATAKGKKPGSRRPSRD